MALAACVSAPGCAAPTVDDDSASSEEAATATATGPADTEATPQTRTVLANLHSFDFASPNPFDRRILVGQASADISNRRTSGVVPLTPDVQTLTGKLPALVGYELASAYLGSTSLFDPAGFRAGAGALRARILDQHRQGALVTLAWHMRCPKAAGAVDLYGPSQCPSSYKLEELLERKSDGSPGAHFAEWRAMLDEVAELLWSLKDERGRLVPVQIRPFHEFTGTWFWWGATNPPQIYAAVWREMVTYLRAGRGLHNVLWVFCPNTPSEGPDFKAFYPGDAYVDVVAFDRYDGGGKTFLGGSQFDRGYAQDLNVIGSFARAHGKVAAVAEVGTELSRRQPSDASWFTRKMLAPLKARGRSFAYVALWSNSPWEKFVPERGDGPIADDFKTMASDPATLWSGQHDLYQPLHAAP